MHLVFQRYIHAFASLKLIENMPGLEPSMGGGEYDPPAAAS